MRVDKEVVLGLRERVLKGGEFWYKYERGHELIAGCLDFLLKMDEHVGVLEEQLELVKQDPENVDLVRAMATQLYIQGMVPFLERYHGLRDAMKRTKENAWKAAKFFYGLLPDEDDAENED